MGIQKLNQLERKARKLAIPHLMYYICGGMLLVFLLDFCLPQLGMGSLLSLDRAAVGRGEIWRLITFIFEPINNSPIWILFSLYFYILIGESLEREWGSFRFNLFYLTGILGAVIAAMLTGYGHNIYLNLSLFLAFAFFYPDYEVLIFFILPVKVKYLAILDLILLVATLIMGEWSSRIAVLFSLINVILYFGKHFLKNFRQWQSYQKTRRNFRKYMR